MRARSVSLGAALWALLAPIACVDIVHEDEVQALGPEAPGVPPGPLHRPGQPCVTCHGGSGPGSQQLAIGGTVYAVQGESAPAVGAVVQIEDIDGHFWTVQTNEAGNFFVTTAEWQPHYPVGSIQVTLGDVTQSMFTHVGRDGSCADCHQATPGPTSPGPIYINLADAGGP